MDRMLKFFGYEHLRPELQMVALPFHVLAQHVAEFVPAGPERTVALRKLLEAKDAAVRTLSDCANFRPALWPTRSAN
jgi:hypothetical protein